MKTELKITNHNATNNDANVHKFSQK